MESRMMPPTFFSKVGCRAVLLFTVFSVFSIFAHSQNENTLIAGFHSDDLTPWTGVPLAGYGDKARRIVPWDFFNKHKYAHYLKPSKGKLDPLRVKVLALQNGPKKLLFIGLDILALTADIRADIVDRLSQLGFGEDEIFILPTHTHSGFGAMTRNFVWQVIAVDRFHPEVYRFFMEKIYWAAAKAVLKQEPADLYSTSFETEGINRNRRRKQNREYTDRQARILLARAHSDDRILGAMVNFAIHGTSQRPKNLKYSADINGAIERHLEKRLHALNGMSGSTPNVIFINGAEGDVSPAKGGPNNMEPLAMEFANQAMPALGQLTWVDPNWDVVSSSLKLARPGLNVRGCIEQDGLKKLIWKRLKVHLGWAMPRHAKLWQIRLGNILMMTWPGEATTELGLTLKDHALDLGADQMWFLGLANDYLAYFTTKKEYHGGGYESCNSLYGEKAGENIIKRHKEMSQVSWPNELEEE